MPHSCLHIALILRENISICKKCWWIKRKEYPCVLRRSLYGGNKYTSFKCLLVNVFQYDDHTRVITVEVSRCSTLDLLWRSCIIEVLNYTSILTKRSYEGCICLCFYTGGADKIRGPDNFVDDVRECSRMFVSF